MVAKTKITSFETEGVRGGRSLEAILSEIGLDRRNGERQGDSCNSRTEPFGGIIESGESAGANENNGAKSCEGVVLQICRLSFSNAEKARSMCRVILSRVWAKIVLEKTNGRFVSTVLQACVVSTKVLLIKQHQRYDGIKWNFGLDWFPEEASDRPATSDDGGVPRTSCCPLEEVYLTAVRFRGGDELAFLRSLSEGLARGAVASTTTGTADRAVGGRPIGLRVLELNACRFMHPDVQYPILFRGLRVACFGTLERLWMPKSPGLDDDRFEEIFGTVLRAGRDGCSIRELGFSYNGCGWKGSRAVASFLEAQQSANLRVLYLNRQHGELDLDGILRAAANGNSHFGGDGGGDSGGSNNYSSRKLHLNLSQNYVSGTETLEALRGISSGGMGSAENETNTSLQSSLRVELDSMSFEVPETVFPGNGGSRHQIQSNNNGRGKNDASSKSYENHVQNLSKEEIAKLNVACGRVKYVLGRAASASNRSTASPSSTQSNPSSVNKTNTNNDTASATGSDWFFSSLAALDCVLPDLLTILRLQEKQNASKPDESNAINDDPQQNQHLHQSHRQQRQYRNWLPTFLRKSIKGKVELLKPWLLSASEGSPHDRSDQEETTTDSDITAKPHKHECSEAEKVRLRALWVEIEALHTNIAQHNGQWRHKHSAPYPSDGSHPTQKPKGQRKKKHGRKGLPEIPMTPQENPLVRAAYEAIPVISTSILESPNTENSSPFLSLPMRENDETGSEVLESDRSIKPVPPLFIDTAEDLLKLRDDLFRKPPPHKLPRMVAIDSEWYFSDDAASGAAGQTNQVPRIKKTKNRSMSVATLQIAYVDENTSPMLLRSFVIDLLSSQPGFQKLAKDYVSWLFGSASCDMMILGFAFGGDLRQLRKYAGIVGYQKNGNKNDSDLASLETVESRCLDIQRLLASPEEVRAGKVPGLKKCAHHYFAKPLKKDDQTSDWRERPLRPSQLEYAALDAVILLVLLSQKKREDESSATASG